MSNEDPERLMKILVLFFQQFKGTRFDENFAQDYGFDDLIKVKFTMEHEDLQLPPNLQRTLQHIVNQQDLAQNDAGI